MNRDETILKYRQERDFMEFKLNGIISILKDGVSDASLELDDIIITKKNGFVFIRELNERGEG